MAPDWLVSLLALFTLILAGLTWQRLGRVMREDTPIAGPLALSLVCITLGVGVLVLAFA